MKRGVAIALAVAIAPATSGADPLRLRADALATTASPAGLFVLDAGGAPRAGWSAEAVVWLAAQRAPGAERAGDALVIALRGRTRSGRLGVRVGRFVSALGALRPAHVDGGAVQVRLPKRIDVELVGGLPVVPGLATARAWDWIAGARLARRIGDGGSAGIAYAQRRDRGQLASEELGLDAGMALGAQLDAAARLAYDLATPGIAEIAAMASYRRRSVRAELFASQRAASHLLPATSLFSVIGDVPARRLGTTVTWRAAPRLDVSGELGARFVDTDAGLELLARGKLRLDDRGASALTGELRRSGAGDDAWRGVRGTARIALSRELAVSAELEVVVLEVDRGRGTLWPWGLAAVHWQRGPWQVALALEGSASSEHRHRVDALAQLGRTWGRP